MNEKSFLASDVTRDDVSNFLLGSTELARLGAFERAPWVDSEAFAAADYELRIALLGVGDLGDRKKNPPHRPPSVDTALNGRPTANLKFIDRTSAAEEAEDIFARMRNAYLDYHPFSLWENQEYYVQVAVEKMGVYSLFQKPTAEFDVPLVNIGGWSDVNSCVEMMRRFAYWEARGKKCVLLVFVDHDPGGLLIAEFLRKNLSDLSNAVGWSPKKLIIVRFGLKPDFIRRHRLSCILIWKPVRASGSMIQITTITTRITFNPTSRNSAFGRLRRTR